MPYLLIYVFCVTTVGPNILVTSSSYMCRLLAFEDNWVLLEAWFSQFNNLAIVNANETEGAHLYFKSDILCKICFLCSCNTEGCVINAQRSQEGTTTCQFTASKAQNKINALLGPI